MVEQSTLEAQQFLKKEDKEYFRDQRTLKNINQIAYKLILMNFNKLFKNQFIYQLEDIRIFEEKNNITILNSKFLVRLT